MVSGLRGSLGLNAPATAQEQARALEALGSLGLRELAPRQVGELSYGELRKLLIARAMVNGPALLLLDEPLAGLDVDSRAQVARILADLAARGVGLLLVTHHPGDLLPCLTHALVLERGRVTYAGPLAGRPSHGHGNFTLVD